MSGLDWWTGLVEVEVGTEHFYKKSHDMVTAGYVQFPKRTLT